MPKSKLKRKFKYQDKKIELSLSDIEQDRKPVQVNYMVKNVSNDRRRVARHEHHVAVKTEKVPASELPETSADSFFFDLGAIDIDAVQSEKTKLKEDGFRKQRYVSSVSTVALLTRHRGPES